MKRFAGKVVIITGSSSGIGQTAALSFAEEGASVLIHGQNKERLEKTEKLLLAEGIPPTRIAKVLGSMEDPKTAELIVAECMRKFGRIDVLINNAGAFSKPGTADPDRMDNLDFLYNVNMRSVVQLTQLAMPHLERAKGNVISVSSCLALRQAMDAYFYGMLKAAMDHWTRGMAQKWGPRGVRFNCINPGPVDTPIFERNGLGGDLKKMHERWVEKTTPLGRYGQTSEMAGPLKFLASDEAAYITGACMSVDGGWAIASVGMDQV